MTNPITQQASMAAADMQAKQADARDKARINNENKTAPQKRARPQRHLSAATMTCCH